MPRIEKKSKIKASDSTIFGILENEMNMAKWNIVVNEVTEIGHEKYFLKTNVGDVTSTRVEHVPNEKISATQEGSPMTALGYILTPKEDLIEVTLWAEFDDPDQEGMLGIAGEIFLKSLKKYAVYLESGGNPAEFKK